LPVISRQQSIQLFPVVLKRYTHVQTESLAQTGLITVN
jgi:hypothetical protein